MAEQSSRARTPTAIMATLVHQRGLYSLQFYNADRTPQRKRVPLRVRSQRDAERVRRKLERDYALGLFDPWTDDPLTYDRTVLRPERMGPACSAFLAAKRHKAPRTQEDYRKVTGRFVEHVGADTLVSRVEASDVEEWLDTTAAGDVTRHTYCRNLKVFFRWARREGVTDTVATDGVRLRKLPRKFPRFMTPDEVGRIVAAVREGARSAHWLADLVVFACHTGLRRGELVNLVWDAVDVDARTLVVANTDSFRTKSGEDRRVPLSGDAVEALLRLSKKEGCPYVFVSARGKLSADYLSQAFKLYARKAGLDDVHLHHTRHTACSWLAQRGVPVETIRKFAGHSTITVTERYMHVAEDVYAAQIIRALGTP